MVGLNIARARLRGPQSAPWPSVYRAFSQPDRPLIREGSGDAKPNIGTPGDALDRLPGRRAKGGRRARPRAAANDMQSAISRGQGRTVGGRPRIGGVPAVL